jgi:hypothetical protein
LIEYGRFLDPTQAGAVLESSERQQRCMTMFVYAWRAFQGVNEWILNDVTKGDFYNLLKALLAQWTSSPEVDYMQALTSVVHFIDTSPSKVDFAQVSAVFQKAWEVLSHPQIVGLEVGSKVLVPFLFALLRQGPPLQGTGQISAAWWAPYPRGCRSCPCHCPSPEWALSGPSSGGFPRSNTAR